MRPGRCGCVAAGRVSSMGPFAETKEVLAGFNLIEAESLEDAVRIAQEFPWTKYGCIEVRPVRDVDAVRQQRGCLTRRSAVDPPAG